jgi:uncharacterized membrane protein
MTATRMIELVVALVIAAVGVWLYRRRDKSDTYGSQGAVILFVIAAIMAIHALGGLDYRPSQSELEAMREQAR